MFTLDIDRFATTVKLEAYGSRVRFNIPSEVCTLFDWRVRRVFFEGKKEFDFVPPSLFPRDQPIEVKAVPENWVWEVGDEILIEVDGHDIYFKKVT